MFEVRTSKGALQFQLDAELAPETVRNFMNYVSAVTTTARSSIRSKKVTPCSVVAHPDMRERTGRYRFAVKRTTA